MLSGGNQGRRVLIGGAVGLVPGVGPPEEGFRRRGPGGFSRASSSLLPRVYHRRTADAEKACRWEEGLLKKAGGGLQREIRDSRVSHASSQRNDARVTGQRTDGRDHI